MKCCLCHGVLLLSQRPAHMSSLVSSVIFLRHVLYCITGRFKIPYRFPVHVCVLWKNAKSFEIDVTLIFSLFAISEIDHVCISNSSLNIKKTKSTIRKNLSCMYVKYSHFHYSLTLFNSCYALYVGRNIELIIEAIQVIKKNCIITTQHLKNDYI